MAITNNYTNLANINLTNSTDSTTSTTSTNSTGSVTRATNNELGKDAFLKLLIAELSNQDPLNPMEDREFISQMATFSQLEQLQNMGKTLDSISEGNKFTAVSYIGKAVAFTKGEGDDAEQTAAVVNHVWFEPDGKVILDTTEGEISLEDVEGVSSIS